MQAIVFALISYFGWAIGDIFGTIASRKLGAYSTAFWRLLLGFILFSFYIPFALHDLTNLTLGLLIFMVCLGLFGIIGLVTLYEGLTVGNPALVGTIASSFAAISVLISVIFLNEKVSLNQIVSILVIFLGLILSVLDIKTVSQNKVVFNKGIVFALVTMVIFGIYFALIKIPIEKVGWFWPIYVVLSTFPALFLYMKIKGIKINIPASTKQWWLLGGLVGSWAVADFGYNLGLSHGLVAVVAPIASSSPTLFVVLAFLLFKESINKQQIIGILITLTGIVSLSFLSV